ncbi:MAG: hypothetical protein C0404_11535 [Verrucomicrobia bacterium]|nr:hypothetical protein [Verrucomicrobiota bacterium]
MENHQKQIPPAPRDELGSKLHQRLKGQRIREEAKYGAKVRSGVQNVGIVPLDQVGVGKPFLYNQTGCRKRQDRQANGHKKSGKHVERQAARHIRSQQPGERERQNAQRSQQKQPVKPGIPDNADSAVNSVHVEIACKQHALVERHAGAPDHEAAPHRRQHHPGSHRLYQEQQECRKKGHQLICKNSFHDLTDIVPYDTCMFSGKAISVIFCLMALQAGAEDPSPPPAAAAGVPGVTRQKGSTFLIENHSTALLIMHARNIRGTTMIHVDAHDDCRHIAPAKLAAIRQTLAARDYQALFSLSDEDFIQRYRIRGSRTLFDLGNFIYPCLLDGTVSNLVWVIPDKTLPKESAVHLQMHLRSVLRTGSLTDLVEGDNRFTFRLHGATIAVTTLDALQAIKEPAVLDLDADFFSLPQALTEQYSARGLTRPIPEVCNTLSTKIPNRELTIVASSLEGGYLPVSMRYVPEACFLYFSENRYPAYADRLTEGLRALQTNQLAALPDEPLDPAFLPAYHFLSGHAAILNEDVEKAIPMLQKAASQNTAYKKGFLDCANTLFRMGRMRMAERMVGEYERSIGAQSIGSDQLRTRIMLASGRLAEAEATSKRMIDWDRTVNILTTRAGVLFAHGKLDEAKALYDEALTESPQQSLSCYNVGVILQRQRKIDEAIDYYRRATIQGRDFAEAFENLGVCLAQKGALDEAISSLTKAAELSPDKFLPHATLGLIWTQKGNPAQATASYEKALSINPTDADMHATTASLYLQQGLIQKAGEHCAAALKLKPALPAALELQKKIMEKTKEVDVPGK